MTTARFQRGRALHSQYNCKCISFFRPLDLDRLLNSLPVYGVDLLIPLASHAIKSAHIQNDIAHLNWQIRQVYAELKK